MRRWDERGTICHTQMSSQKGLKLVSGARTPSHVCPWSSRTVDFASRTSDCSSTLRLNPFVIQYRANCIHLSSDLISTWSEADLNKKRPQWLAVVRVVQ